MKPERTQQGNPHNLTINQHVFPVRSISRFADADGQVSVRICRARREVRLSPHDQIFCAARAWDQRAESGYIKKIEDRFQDLADQVINGRHSIDMQASVITRFFLLWCLRFQAKHSPVPDHVLNGIVPEILSKDQQEVLEKKGVGFIRRDQTLPGRLLSGLQIQRDIDRLAAGFEGKRWASSKPITASLSFLTRSAA